MIERFTIDLNRIHNIFSQENEKWDCDVVLKSHWCPERVSKGSEWRPSLIYRHYSRYDYFLSKFFSYIHFNKLLMTINYSDQVQLFRCFVIFILQLFTSSRYTLALLLKVNNDLKACRHLASGSDITFMNCKLRLWWWGNW